MQVLIWVCEQLVHSWTPPKYLLQPPRGDHGDTSPEVPLDHGMPSLARMAEFQHPEEPQAPQLPLRLPWWSSASLSWARSQVSTHSLEGPEALVGPVPRTFATSAPAVG